MKEDRLTIHNRMLQSVPDEHDKSEGSFIFDATKPVAIEMEKASEDRSLILEKAFPQRSANQYSEYLDLFAEAHGVPRDLGQKASGTCTFKGTTGKEVRFNTIIETETGLQYIVLESGVLINGEVTLPIVAIKVGTIYNVPSGSIKFTPITIDGVSEINNNTPTEGGANVESDDSLLSRLIQRLSSPPSSGNVNDYIRWAKEVSGVKFANIIPLWNGPGTVKIVVAGEDGYPVDGTIITTVKNYIDPISGKGEGKAPIGASVTVVTVEKLIVNIHILGLTTEADYSKEVVVMQHIPNVVKNYFSQLDPGGVIRFKEVEAIIINAIGVLDFDSISLNGVSGNIAIGDEEKAVLGVVSYE